MLVNDIATTGWNARLALLLAGMVVHSTHQHQPQNSKLVQNMNNSEMIITTSFVRLASLFRKGNLWVAGMINNGGIINWAETYQIALVAKGMNTLVSVVAESYVFTCFMTLDQPKVRLHVHFIRDYVLGTTYGVIIHCNQLNHELPLALVKLCSNPLVQPLSYEHPLSGVCCRNICYFR